MSSRKGLFTPSDGLFTPLAPVPSECSKETEQDETLNPASLQGSPANFAARMPLPSTRPGSEAFTPAFVRGTLPRFPDGVSSSAATGVVEPEIAELTAAVRRVKDLEIENANLELRLTRAEAARDQSEAEVGRLKAEKDELSAGLRRMEKDRNDLAARIVSLEEASADNTAEKETERGGDVADLRKKLKAAEHKSKALSKNLEEARAKVANLEWSVLELQKSPLSLSATMQSADPQPQSS
eukprot:Hpha_TRINITY_DN15791_c10_g1::TRINITY_DN15791_c10_g1_i1::g.41595::m.41595